jgi:hypothetical protein
MPNDNGEISCSIFSLALQMKPGNKNYDGGLRRSEIVGLDRERDQT